MSEMVERVARANQRVWDEWPEPIDAGNVEEVRSAAARAAIVAMREPIPEMMAKGFIADDCADPAGIYRAMIDAALTDGGE